MNFRRARVSFLSALDRNNTLLVFFLLTATLTCTAGTFSGTLSTTNSPLTWTSAQTGVIGQTQTGTGVANPPCNATLCDLYNLTVNVPPTYYAANPNFAIHVNASWSSSLIVSLAHVFPSLALDHAGNLYIAFSDGSTSFLTASSDGGASWTTPVRVNAGANLRTTVEPWVVAGDIGKVDVFFYGTSDASFNSSTAKWSIYLSQSLNALAPVPLFTISAATGVMHIGAICNNGLGCANGTRNLLEYFYPDVYPDGNVFVPYPDDLHVNPATTITNVWMLKQTGGSKIIGQ